MEHTEGNLTARKPMDMSMRHIFINCGDVNIARVDGYLEKDRRPTKEEATVNADRLVKCWNEYDTLNAKADLCDELMDALEKAESAYDIAINATPTGAKRVGLTGHNILRYTVIDKFKEITK